MLGLSRSATPAKVRARYLELARVNHPDAAPHKPDAAAAFQRYTDAYERARAQSGAPLTCAAAAAPPTEEFLARAASFAAYRERLRALRPPPAVHGAPAAPPAWRRAALLVPALALVSWCVMEKMGARAAQRHCTN